MADRLEQNEAFQSSATASQAGLRYVSDDEPGIRRRRVGRGFAYYDPRGRRIVDPSERARLNALAIPPAWRDVWIAPARNSHLLATGRDAKDRKQFRYHRNWQALRERTKFDRMPAFGQALPPLREQVDADLRRHGLPRDKVLAAVVRLLETTLIRVGNEEYARDNRSFGLTTLRQRHVDVTSTSVSFEFKGKSGKWQQLRLADRRLARIVGQIQELPGQRVFQYLDEAGTRRLVDSGEVNDYLRQITGDDFTAKDFRTWAGTVLAAWALQAFEAFDSEAAAKRNITAAIERVARQLGNTVAVCRRSYVHPAVLDAYLEGSLLERLKSDVDSVLRTDLPGLSPEEAAVLAFLRQRLGHEIDAGPDQAASAST
ncbi:MAG: DNA topoisomerase IB [Geminicoccaceae bacterium]